MQNYLHYFEQFKEIKEMIDIIDDVVKLRTLYNASKFEEMKQHIRNITCKYPTETIVWNTFNPYAPVDYVQLYINAENFMKAIGIKTLIDKGITISKELLGENK